MTALVFERTGAPSTNLVFGDTGLVAPRNDIAVSGVFPALTARLLMVPPVEVSITGAFPALTVAVNLAPSTRLNITGAFAGLQFAAEASYHTNTQRPLVNDLLTTWQNANDVQTPVQQRFNNSLLYYGFVEARPQDAAPQPAYNSGGWADASRLPMRTVVGFDDGVLLRDDVMGVMQDGLNSDRDIIGRFDDGVLRRTSLHTSMQDGLKDRRKQHDESFDEAVQRRFGLGTTGGYAKPLQFGRRGPFQDGKRPPAGINLLPLPPGPLPNTCYLLNGDLLFADVPGSPYLVFACDNPVTPSPPPTGLVVVPVQRVYIVINDAYLRRVDGNIHLPTFGMTLSLDVDSWTWGFSASLPTETLVSLEPASTGAPVEVEAMVNGVPYRALVESISRSRSFGKASISIQGRGRAALLDSPYSPVSNFTNTEVRTAQQIMGDVLSVNGVPMPWAVNWGLTDWLIPTGAFSHQGSYIGALGRIAESAGGYLQPHASAQTMSVLPRYPSTPWTWGEVTPDFELPADVTTTEGIAWVEKARYNRVFVSGEREGVLGQVTRTGTAGDLLAPMITDALITHADAARQRGLSVLANTGRQANVSIKLPVLAETGVITPGKFVRYVDGATSRIGIVRSVGVDVGSPDIFQTLGIETHVN